MLENIAQTLFQALKLSKSYKFREGNWLNFTKLAKMAS